MKVAIGSTNPAKCEGVSAAFAQLFAGVEIEYVSCDVESGVDHQPIGNETTLLGAGNRAVAAMQLHPDCDYAVGIESGIDSITVPRFLPRASHGVDLRVMDVQWVVVIKAGEDFPAIGPIQSIPVPPAILSLMGGLGRGVGLGGACDQYFDEVGSKTKGGFTGIYTDNLLTRSVEISHGVILALQQFLKPRLWL